jgi:hypothetical protein
MKVYVRYTGYPGGLRETMKMMLDKKGVGEVVRKTVDGMIPRNKLRKERMKRLTITAPIERANVAEESLLRPPSFQWHLCRNSNRIVVAARQHRQTPSAWASLAPRLIINSWYAHRTQAGSATSSAIRAQRNARSQAS